MVRNFSSKCGMRDRDSGMAFRPRAADATEFRIGARPERGSTIIETLAALAIGAMMMAGLVALINESISDSTGQQAALYQAKVSEAATKFIARNYRNIQTTATEVAPAVITIAQLQQDGFLPAGFNTANAYGQTPCVLVLEPNNAQRLEALVVTEGGRPIPVRDLVFIASNSGQGGGYISADNPTRAQGVFNSWQAPLANYVSANCSGTAAGANHLATAIYFDGPGNLNTDFLYRGAVEGHPELNEMRTPLRMLATAVEDSSDPAGTVGGCIAGDANTFGRIAVDAAKAVLTCQDGQWKRQGSRFWRDPVATHAALAALPNNFAGDVRLVTSLGRVFTFNGTGWTALAVDENGNMKVENTLEAKQVKAEKVETNVLQLDQTVVKNTACTPNGLVSRDATGLILSCQSGKWRNLLETKITTVALSEDYLITPSSGIQDFRIPLSSIPGPRPLYITGYTHCNATGGTRTMAVAEVMRDTPPAGAPGQLSYTGGCGAKSSSGGGTVLTKGFIGLQKIPENADSIRIYMEPGSQPNDYSLMRLYVFNSE